jgi:hypothetical protein
MTRLVQLKRGDARHVALVDEPYLRLLEDCNSSYELASSAISREVRLSDIVRQRARSERLEYEAIYRGQSDWSILPAIDHPSEPARCMVSGTGLTHLGSAQNRQSMHATLRASGDADLTDSMKMFRWGVEGGRPAAGSVGTAPEWFYRGTGTSLRGHNDTLDVPPYAGDGGEEAELAGIYLIAPGGQPRRIGMAGGNEFSDHVFEKTNYLNLAASKLRQCALGPELVVDPAFESVAVEARIERAGNLLWSKTFRTGNAEMCHSLANIEHHHFKYEAHRRPGDIHVHFFGTDGLSFSDGISLQGGDVMQVSVEGFGRPLRNPLRVAGAKSELISVKGLG